MVVAVALLVPLLCNLLSQEEDGNSRPAQVACGAKNGRSLGMPTSLLLARESACAFVSGKSWRVYGPSTTRTHLSGPLSSQRTLPSKLRRLATPSEMENVIKMATALRSQWRLKEAVDVLSIVISDVPSDTLGSTTDVAGMYLKYAMMLRAEWNLLMGKDDASIAGFRDVLDHLPSDRDARIQLAHALNDGKGDAEQALSVLGDVLDEGPHGAEGNIADIGSFIWAAQDAGVFAASLGKHDTAQKYFELFRKYLCDIRPRKYKYITVYKKTSEETKRYFQGVFYEMVNAMIVGDEQRAEAAGNFYKSMNLNEHPELVWFRQVFTSSWEFITSTPLGTALTPSLFYGTRPMIQLAMDAASLEGGLILELGVWHGSSLRMTASHWPEEKVHGFDTFTGLPEAWGSPEKGGEPVGAYSTFGATPPDLPQNVELHAGLFSDTLPGFVEAHPGPIRFMNVDCDLYSSTKDIFDHVADRIVPGTVILFDEYLMTPTWQDDEFKAFQEAVQKNSWTYEYLAFSIMSGQAIVRIT